MQVIGACDREVARIAGAQKGYVHREQLLAAGLGRGAIAHRLARGRLREVHPCVYLLTPGVPTPFAAEMAAVLYLCGYAIVTGRSAAHVWQMTDAPPREPTLTIVGRDRHRCGGLTLHRAATFDRRDLRLRHGLPVSSPARTLVDLAAEASLPELDQALSTARVRGFVTERELDAALTRANGRRGVTKLRAIIDGGDAPTRSEAERRMLALLRSAELPEPAVNAHVLGFEVDFLWREQRLVVEVDGFAFHGDRTSFERDRRRDQTLTAAGYRVIRITWRQIRDEPYAVIARLAQALAAS